MTSHNFHNAHSNTFDRMASNCTLNVATSFLPTISPPITAQSHILDNACGTGIITALIKAEHPTTKILGADLAPGMLEIYNTKATHQGWENVSTKVLDVKCLQGLDDDTFTHVITNFGFVLDAIDLSGPGKAAREMWRVCKPGGIVVVTTWRERNFDSALQRALIRVRPDEKPFSWDLLEGSSTAGWLHGQLSSAGFGIVEVTAVEGRMEAGSLEELADNILLVKDMACKDYGVEELAILPGILREEIQALDAFGQGESGVEIKMRAWVGMAWK